MVSKVKVPLMTLLSRATERERRLLVSAVVGKRHAQVTLAGVRVLATVRDGEKSVQELATAISTSKQYAAREVQKLVGSGHVSVTPSAEDKRVSLVALAPRGLALLRASDRAKAERERQVEAALGVANLRTLRRLLEALAAGSADEDEV